MAVHARAAEGRGSAMAGKAPLGAGGGHLTWVAVANLIHLSQEGLVLVVGRHLLVRQALVLA